MLSDMLDALLAALASGDKKKIDRAFKNLEKVGVDRLTARILACSREKDLEGK